MNKDEALRCARQALVSCTQHNASNPSYWFDKSKVDDAIARIDAALSEQASKQEVVAWMTENGQMCNANVLRSDISPLTHDHPYWDRFTIPLCRCDALPAKDHIADASNMVPAKALTDWTVTHNGKSVTAESLFKAMMAAKALRTDEEELIAAQNLLRAIDDALDEDEDEIAQLRGECKTIAGILRSAYEVIKTIEPEDRDEEDQLFALRMTIEQALAAYDGARVAELKGGA